MAWGQQTMEALRRWLNPSTWYTGNPIDEERFFLFIATAWNEQHTIWDEAAAREILPNEVRKPHPELGENPMPDVPGRCKSDGTLILDFLSRVQDNKKFVLLTPT